jgi:energy-coupling factor transporter ATP-binding protein EcfA2
MVTQAKKKGVGLHKRGLAAWKEQTGMIVEKPQEGEILKESDLSIMSNANKPQKFILMPKAFQQVTMLPGIPMNTCVSIVGHSNSGKSTLLNHAIAGAQKQGLIPVIIDTENSFSFQYAKAMGFEAEPIYANVEVEDGVDEETGEILKHVERKIIDWQGDFIYYNSNKLAERFGDIDYSTGKKVSKKRKEALIEDVAMAIHELLDAQENGEIEQGFLFCWDSVGSAQCFREYNSGHQANPMWAAAAISQSFGSLVNSRIPSSKNVAIKYDNTFLYINKVWLNNTISPSGPQMETKGGKSLKYATRLEILMGGQLTAGIKRLTAVSKGLNYGYATQTKIKILKNHLDAPHNVVYEGPLIATDTGFIGVDDLDSYKKSHISQILKNLNEQAEGNFEINENDITFEECEATEVN